VASLLPACKLCKDQDDLIDGFAFMGVWIDDLQTLAAVRPAVLCISRTNTRPPGQAGMSVPSVKGDCNTPAVLKLAALGQGPAPNALSIHRDLLEKVTRRLDCNLLDLISTKVERCYSPRCDDAAACSRCSVDRVSVIRPYEQLMQSASGVIPGSEGHKDGHWPGAEHGEHAYASPLVVVF